MAPLNSLSLAFDEMRVIKKRQIELAAINQTELENDDCILIANTVYFCHLDDEDDELQVEVR